MDNPPTPDFPEPLADLTARVQRLVGKGTIPKDLGKLEADEVRRQEESYFSGELGPIEGGNTFMSKSKVTSPEPNMGSVSSVEVD